MLTPAPNFHTNHDFSNNHIKILPFARQNREKKKGRNPREGREYQLEVEGLSKRVWREKEPKSFWEGGDIEGMIPKGKPFRRNESCWIRRALLARAPSKGKGSPGTDLAEPSKVCGEDMLWSQNAESIADSRFAIFGLTFALDYLGFEVWGFALSELFLWHFEMMRVHKRVFGVFWPYV